MIILLLVTAIAFILYGLGQFLRYVRQKKAHAVDVEEVSEEPVPRAEPEEVCSYLRVVDEKEAGTGEAEATSQTYSPLYVVDGNGDSASKE